MNELAQSIPQTAPLTPELLARLYRACKRNAAELLEAAGILLAEFPAPAFALASTAREELAKAQMAADVNAGIVSQKAFHEESFDHLAKHAYLARKIEWPEGAPGSAKESHSRAQGRNHFNRRNQSLFVRLVAGNVEEPRDVISCEEARELIGDTHDWSCSMNFSEALTGSASSKAAAAIREAQ